MTVVGSVIIIIIITIIVVHWIRCGGTMMMMIVLVVRTHFDRMIRIIMIRGGGYRWYCWVWWGCFLDGEFIQFIHSYNDDDNRCAEHKYRYLPPFQFNRVLSERAKRSSAFRMTSNTVLSFCKSKSKFPGALGK